ncbi:hypothetical protein [Clostridium frigidicarnis]|uniref:Uncharacterized protein n=1 Tax=Clostridium frigidicarnis TaxID=84698 RepID=A0A1I1ANN6_9CLOT|nr:hypothetical protein [Clostridium frigidicarnis]SFB38000.1 hypothetical protein SAMN04488528_103821 [Clostridium frigidicarnis]
MEMYFEFSMARQIGNSNGKIVVKNGAIDSASFSNNLSSAEVDFLKGKVKSLSQVVGKLGNAQINFKINSISSNHFNITLEIETSVTSSIKAYQSLNIIFYKDDYKDDSKLNLNTVKIGAIAVVGVLAIITIGVLAPELLPALVAI